MPFSNAIMSSPNTSVQQLEISDLPSEVLLRIFKYLSVTERKAVKSVSKCWMKLCNESLSLLDDEVLVCRGLYQLSDIYQLIGKSERKFLILKFECVIFDYGSSFWEHNESRIRSITFIDCLFPNGLLEDIIVSCTSLFHLSFTYTQRFSYILRNTDLLPPIKDIEKVSVIRESLEFLEIDIKDSDKLRLSDYILHQLLLIFPKIKILKITSDFGYRFSKNIDVNLSEVTNKYRVSMSPVLSYLIASSERIEKVKLDFRKADFSPSGLRCILETVSSLKRLKELSILTSKRSCPCIEEIDTYFCSKQLKSLEISVNMELNDLLFSSKLLLPNSSLRHLKIELPYLESQSVVGLLTNSVCEKVMGSGLKSFMLTVEKKVADCSFARLVVTVLPSLSFSMESIRPVKDDLESFLQHSVLQNLEISSISEMKLQCLLKYQKKLKSLSITKFSPWYQFIINRKIHPKDLRFNELTDIEYLNLVNPTAAFLFLRTLSPKPLLSKLKCLCIHSDAVEKEFFPADLLRVADAIPFLEKLVVHDRYDSILSFDDILKLCTKLTRLRYLFYTYIGGWHVNDGSLTDEHCQKVFSICSSLRTLQYGSKLYFFDTLNKKVALLSNFNDHAVYNW